MRGRDKLEMIMKKGRNNLCVRTAALCMAAAAWWGVLYPELCFTENTCVQVIVSQGQEIVIRQADCQDILNASGDEILIKSRLLEWLEEQKYRKQNTEQKK